LYSHAGTGIVANVVALPAAAAPPAAAPPAAEAEAAAAGSLIYAGCVNARSIFRALTFFPTKRKTLLVFVQTSSR
jgi:hypothetical protein